MKRTLTFLLCCSLCSSVALAEESVSPSPKTRSFPAPAKDYFQQITKGLPFRWFEQDMAVKVLIRPGDGIPNFKPKFDEMLRQSFREWEAISNAKIKFQFVTEPPADITCRFVASIPKSPPSVAGNTAYQTSPHHVDSAEISIKTSSTITTLTDDLFHGICLHEIGHALGLLNHSLDPHDVMYPYITKQKSLSMRDVNTIRKLYDFKPPESITRPFVEKPSATPMYPFGLIVLSNDEYDAYSRQVVAKLLKNFSPFQARPPIECSISCLVDSSGNIFNYRIFESSRNEDFDQKALTALLSALPLPPQRLSKSKWAKTPIAINFRSDGQIVPFIEPDPHQSDWLHTLETPSPDELLRDLIKDKGEAPKVTDPNIEPWVIQVSQKAHSAWKVENSGKAEVILGIRRNGNISHMIMLQSSGSEKFDSSVLNACMSAEPYPEAPNTSLDTTEVNLLFER